LCAETLGIELESVTILHGNTKTAPYGHGTWGSRSAVVGDGALLKCVEKLKQKIIEIAAAKLQLNPDQIEFKHGAVYVNGSSGPSYTLRELVEMASEAENHLPGAQPSLEVSAVYEPLELTISGGFHVVEVVIDLETAEVRILKYVVVHDCGLMLNPAIVEGQLQGGLAQGIGGALLEEVRFDEDAQIQTATFMDYLIPCALDVPNFELAHTVTPSPFNTLGIKGMGESGIIGPAAAINNAICDAMGGMIKLNKTPISSSELWTKIRGLYGGSRNP
jgi:carbon-monoxide dehydrogenase large subunit